MSRRESSFRGFAGGGRRPPINYTSRSVKLRLFVLIAGLMIVLAFAERARDPKTWNWFKQLDERAAQREAVPNPRLTTEPSVTANDPAGTFVAVGDAPREPSPEETSKLATLDPVERAWKEGWKDVFERLSLDQRTLLFEMLHAAANRAALDPARHQAAAMALQDTTTWWEDYQAAAFQSVAALQGDDQALWVDVLRQVNRRFSDQVRPALQTVIDGGTPTESAEQALTKLQQTLTELTLARIEDDTMFRPAEREIWFHELARVRDTQPKDLQRQSVGEIAYLQLFKQPADYRGEVVTVSGTVKLAYRVQAPQNYLGIKEYFVFWLHPKGGPDAPIVVYALAAPPGFPQIKDKDLDAATTKLHEDISVTGVFFKRWAYLGKDATYSAPLVLTNQPQWTPRATLKSRVAGIADGPGGLAAMVGAGLVLVVVALLAVSRLGARSRLASEEQPPGLQALRDLPTPPTTEESLRQLEREARSGMQC